MKKEKDIFRKNVIDIIAILPSKEGTVELGKDNYTTMRVPISMVTNIDQMNRVFRQMWVALAKDDPLLKKEFETYFRNEEIAKKKMEKMLQKMALKGNTKQTKKIGEKLKQYEESTKSSDDKKGSSKRA